MAGNGDGATERRIMPRRDALAQGPKGDLMDLASFFGIGNDEVTPSPVPTRGDGTQRIGDVNRRQLSLPSTPQMQAAPPIIPVEGPEQLPPVTQPATPAMTQELLGEPRLGPTMPRDVSGDKTNALLMAIMQLLGQQEPASPVDAVRRGPLQP